MANKDKAFVAGAAAAAGVAAFALVRALRRPPVRNPDVPQPAKAVDLDRYLGDWFEIARYDQRFERGCIASTARYSRRDDGAIEVLNRCRKQDGGFDEARGIAKVADSQTGAKLKVSFFGPFYGDYWVLDHSDDYSWSIVGEPSGRYLWILARQARPGERQVKSLVSRVSAMGYDTEALIFDRH